MHLSNLQDARRRIEQCRFDRHEDEVRRRQEYEQEYGNPYSALETIDADNVAADADHKPKGPPAFTRALRTLQWPHGFKITGVDPYEGRMNPTQWLQAYATAVRTVGGDTSVMANYLPIMLMPPAMRWFTSLAPDSIGSWEELKKSSPTIIWLRVLGQAPSMISTASTKSHPSSSAATFDAFLR